MKLSTHQAAFLYLLKFNLCEGGLAHEEEATREIDELLTTNLYPASEETIYDNDGGPMVAWGDWDSNFNYETWVEGFLDEDGYNGLLDQALNPDNCLEEILEKIQ